MIYKVWFYGISNIVGYLMPFKSILYIYIKYMICKYIVLITFLNKPELIFASLNGFSYFCPMQIILFTINNLFALS